jgi:uncharacterized protein YcaQ
VHYHSLDCFDRLDGEPGIAALFRRIGSVQYDPLNVAGRNPCLVLQSRIKNFSPELLDKLLYQDRVLVDAWDKEMSIYRTSDWPCFNRVRKIRAESQKNTLSWRGQEEVLSYSSRIKEIIKWDRMMVQKIFDFQYRWEVYVPAEKRKYGYYVLPVLYQNKIVGRMEPVPWKTGDPLRIKNWWWEPDTKITGKLRKATEGGLKKFAEYLKAGGLDRGTLEIIFQ